MVLRGWLTRRFGYRSRRYGGVKKRAKKEGKKLATVQYVRKAIDNTTEKKFILVQSATLSTTFQNSAPIQVLLNGLTQGTTDNTRLGDRCRAKRLLMTVYVSVPVSATGLCSRYILDVLWYKNPRGGTPSFLNLYGSNTPGAVEQFNYNTIDFSSRFQILSHQEHQNNPQAINTTSGFTFEVDLDLQDHMVDYSLGNVGTVADIDKGALYLMMHVDNSLVTNVYYSYYYWYMDL